MNDFNLKLKKCESLKQIFDLVNENFETSEKMGAFTGNIVKNKIPDIIKLLNLNAKK